MLGRWGGGVGTTKNTKSTKALILGLRRGDPHRIIRCEMVNNPFKLLLVLMLCFD